MRIGIIGGGAAGLATAWLLERDHEVTLFEKDDRSAATRTPSTSRSEGGSSASTRAFSSSRRARRTRRSTVCSTRSRFPAGRTRRRSPSPRLDGTLAHRDAAVPRAAPGVEIAGSRARSAGSCGSDRSSPAFRRSSLEHDTTSPSPSTSSAGGCRDRSSRASCSRSCSRSGASTSRTSAASPPTTRSTTSAPTSRGACDRRPERDPGRPSRLCRSARRVPRAGGAARRCAVASVTRDSDGTLGIEVGGVRHPFDHLVFACDARQAHRYSRPFPNSMD